jgi:hypothetical protein
MKVFAAVYKPGIIVPEYDGTKYIKSGPSVSSQKMNISAYSYVNISHVPGEGIL